MNIFLFLLIGLFSFSAFAETNQERASKVHDQILQQQRAVQEHEEQERERRLRERAPLVSPIAPPIAPELEASTQCFTIHTITLEGVTKLSAAEKKILTADSIDKCLNVSALKTLVHRITKAYFDAGYVTTQVFIPKQNLASGALMIRVVEGFVESIEFDDSSNSALWLSRALPNKLDSVLKVSALEKKAEPLNTVGSRMQLATAFPVSKDEVLNLRDIEQGLDQMNRVASNRVTMKLVPGSKEGGTRVVLSNASLSPARVIGTYDNSGSDTTGVHTGRAMAELDNLFRLNDAWYFSRGQAVSNGSWLKQSENYAFGVSVPYGYWTLSENSSRGTYRVPQFQNDVFFQTSGFSETHAVKIDRVVHRSQDTKTSVYSSLTARNSESYLSGDLMPDKDVRLSIVGVGITHMHRVGTSVLNLTGEYDRGMKIFNARQDPDYVPFGSAQAQFEKVSTTASLYHPFSIKDVPFALRSQVSAQYSPDTLYGTERINLGDLYSVRGFKDHSLQGDVGAYVHNDISHAFVVPWENDSLRETFGDVEPFVGFDAGMARVQGGKSYNFGQGEGTMSGASIGVRNTGSRVNAQLTYSEPIKSPAFIQTRGHEVYFSVTVKTW